jgi:hypothetical protein
MPVPPTRGVCSWHSRVRVPEVSRAERLYLLNGRGLAVGRKANDARVVTLQAIQSDGDPVEVPHVLPGPPRASIPERIRTRIEFYPTSMS